MTKYTRVERLEKSIRIKVHNRIAVLTQPSQYSQGRAEEAERAFDVERMSPMVFSFVVDELERLERDGAYREEFAAMRPDLQQRSKDVARAKRNYLIGAVVL